jgi:dTDP-glucose pyrophosphorylase
MARLSLVMPMAGRGSRFAREGRPMPKPLIDLHGHPFFYWAVESIARDFEIDQTVFVILAEHARDFGLADAIRQYYPRAKVVALDRVTAGAAETAGIGVEALSGDNAFAVNDCDHAFRLARPASIAERLRRDVEGCLVGFRSQNAAYSYVRVAGEPAGDEIVVRGTVEKQAVSDFAIAGCYFFASSSSFRSAYEAFKSNCPYDELFLSGVYNLLCAQGKSVVYQELAGHVSFGTPEELAQVDATLLSRVARS